MQKLNTWIHKSPVWIAVIAVLALQLGNCFSNIAVNKQLVQVESQIKEVRAKQDADKDNNKSIDDKVKALTTEFDNLKTQNQNQDKTLQSIEQKLSKLNIFGDF